MSLIFETLVEVFTSFFRYTGVPQKVSIKLPVTLNKFFEPSEMNSEAFFSRWKNLSGLVSLTLLSFMLDFRDEEYM